MENLSSNRRIAVNTIMLYVRMMINLVISLYTSRVIIQALGVSDYGIYGVVAGVVTMFSFFNSTLAGATARFLSYELGQGNNQRLKDTFSSALVLHVGIAILIIVLCESIGVWFLENKLVIPLGRMDAARWVLQFSILTMTFQILQVPFNAAMITHEKMDVFAYIEIINSVLKLAIVYLLLIGNLDKLVLYAILTCVVSIIIAGFYAFYGLHKFDECCFSLKWSKEVLRPMLTYSGWEFYGNMSLVAITQGVNMLLNMWFGTVMNAAYDIATRVKSIIMSLSSNVTTAVRPQIYKTYSVYEIDRMFSLMLNGSRVTFILMLYFCVPITIEAHYILNIWLGIVPEYSVPLLQLSLLWNLVVSMSLTMNDVVHATGEVKFQCIVPGTMYLCIVPITYVTFKLGAPYWVPFVLNVVTVVTAPFYSGYTIKKRIKEFSWKRHVFPELIRGYFTMVVTLVGTYYLSLFMEEGLFRLIVTVLTSTLLVCIFGYYVILPKEIRNRLLILIKTKFSNHGN